MTKKDYVLIANAIRWTDSQLKNVIKNQFVDCYKIQLLGNIELALSQDNNKFNPKKFETYINK